MIACCLGCEERYVGCHGTCERYAEWLKTARARAEAIKAAKEKEYIADSYVRHNSIKTKRRMGKK